MRHRLDRFVEQSHNNCLNAHAAKILNTNVYSTASRVEIAYCGVRGTAVQTIEIMIGRICQMSARNQRCDGEGRAAYTI